MLRHLGYACINLSLSTTKNKIFTGRTIRLANFTKDKINDICLKNAQDVIKILKWNLQNNIFYFRIASNLFPFYDMPNKMYDITELKDYENIKNELKLAGDFAKNNNIRITTHPGQYTCLASPKTEVSDKAILALEYHTLIGNLLGFNEEFKINIHVNNYLEGFDIIADRFCKNFDKLSDMTKHRLTVENDDNKNAWSINKLYDKIYKVIGIPICFDYHHFTLCNDGENYKEGVEKCFETWDINEVPETHYSESRDNNDLSAHSDDIEKLIPDFSNRTYDCMIESKNKELSLIKYRNKFSVLC